MVRTVIPVLSAAILWAQSGNVLRFAHIQELQSVMEAATVIRSIAEVRDLRADGTSRTVTLSASPWQMELAVWLFGRLDRASTAQHPSMERYEIGENPHPGVRIFYSVRSQTVQNLQELTTIIRSMIEIRRAFTFNHARAVIVRGTPDEIAAAEWLFEELERTDAHSASKPWRMPGVEEGVIRVFYLRPSLSIEELQRNAAAIRVETKIRRMFTYNGPRAVAVRGTAAQVAMAERLIRERQLSAGD